MRRGGKLKAHNIGETMGVQEEEAKNLLVSSLPVPHRMFYAVFQQAQRDIEDFVVMLNSGEFAKKLKEKGWTKKLHWDYTNFKESFRFFSNKDGHLKDLADCANVDLTSRQYKERINMNLLVCQKLQDELCQLENQLKAPEFVSEMDQKLPDILGPIIIPEQPGMGCYGGNY